MSASLDDRFARPTPTDPDRPLRLPVGLLALSGSPVLGALLGTLAMLMVPVGIFCLGYAAAIARLGTRPRVWRAAVGGRSCSIWSGLSPVARLSWRGHWR